MNRRSWLGTALVALLAVVAGVLVLATDALHSTELRTVDARFSVRGPQAPPKDVIVVGLDKRTIEAGEDGKYPIDRARHAAVIDALKHAGAKVIAYDIEFSTPGPDKKSDAALAKCDRPTRRAGDHRPKARRCTSARRRPPTGT